MLTDVWLDEGGVLLFFEGNFWGDVGYIGGGALRQDVLY